MIIKASAIPFICKSSDFWLKQKAQDNIYLNMCFLEKIKYTCNNLIIFNKLESKDDKIIVIYY